ncbi:hypothetical protein JNUCC64_11040 [Streptomyces sp. JNUCC 64]
MEQPIGKNPSLVDAAAIDPAHVPGFATPVAVPKPGAEARPDGGEEAGGEDRTGPEPSDAPGPASKAPGSADAETGTGPDARTGTDADTAPGTGADAGSAVPDGPVFEAADRRGSILVNGTGVSFTLDDQAAEWTWDEIGAVEVATGRFPLRLTLYVHTPDRRWYPNEVRASSKGELRRWTEELDAALDVWFDEATETDEAEEPAGATETAEPDGPAEATGPDESSEHDEDDERDEPKDTAKDGKRPSKR